MVFFSCSCFAGKSGLVGNRMAATLSSLSVACEYIHSGELLHGDLGEFFSVLIQKILAVVLENGGTLKHR